MNIGPISLKQLDRGELMWQMRANPTRFQLLFASGLLADLLEADSASVDRDKFREVIGLPPLERHITVDYSLSLEQMIALGRYGWKNEHITTELFPLKGEGKKEIAVELVKYKKGGNLSDKVLAYLDSKGLRPATIEELLAFGAAFPELQKKFRIVALGSVDVVRGNRVAYLPRSVTRGLELVSWYNGWDAADYRFLAVRE